MAFEFLFIALVKGLDLVLKCAMLPTEASSSGDRSSLILGWAKIDTSQMTAGELY